MRAGVRRAGVKRAGGHEFRSLRARIYEAKRDITSSRTGRNLLLLLPPKSQLLLPIILGLGDLLLPLDRGGLVLLEERVKS